MSKTVGYILVAAAVAFAIAVPVFGLAALGLTAAEAAAISAALSAAIMVNQLLMPKPSVSRNAQETQLQFNEVGRRFAFGETATAGSLVDAFNYGGKYGTDNEVVIFALADHLCDSLVGVYVNDKFVPWVGDGNYPEFDDHHLSMYFRNGSETQTLPSVVTTHGPGWTSNDNGAGICYAVVDYLADSPTAKHPAWPGGRPTFLWVLKGKPLYDPRLDSTVAGGSGSHRWTDPTTYQWSDNPIVAHYNYERGIYACDRVTAPDMLLVGRGLTETEAPPTRIFAGANLCDELVGGDRRYTANGIVASDQEYLEVAEMFAAATGGIIIQPEGSVQIEPAQAKAPVALITDADVVVGSRIIYNQSLLSRADSEWVNTVIPRYVSPAQKYADHAAPVRRVFDDVLADGGSREETIMLQLVTNERQAGVIGEIHRRLGRLWGRAELTLAPRRAEIEEGDWIQWQSDRWFGGATKTFRVENYGLDAKWQNRLKLREINSAVYDGVTGTTGSSTDYSTTTPPIDIGTPDSGNWTLAPATLTNNGVSVGVLELTGSTSDDGSVQAIIIETWPDDGVGGIDPVANPDAPAWTQYGGQLPPSTTKVDITGLQGGTAYFVAVTYIVSGIYGDRLVIGPQTVPGTDVSGQVQPLIDAATGKLTWKNPVRAKTAAALAANTYANGTSGVGATLTGNSNGALAAVDGVTLALNDRALVDQEATGSHNGIYKLTQVGDGSHPYILTRAIDADEPAELVNAAVKISEGSTFADQEWQCTNNATITVGTTALVFAPATVSSTYTPPAVTSQSGTSYTAVLADANGFVRFTSGSSVTFTIPPNSSVAFPVGTEIHFSQSGAGSVTVAPGASVTINSRAADLTLAGQYAVAFVKKVATDTWIMNGDL